MQISLFKKQPSSFFPVTRFRKKLIYLPQKVKNVDIHVVSFFPLLNTQIKPIEVIFMISDSIQSFLSHFALRLDSELVKKRIRQKKSC